MPQFFKSKQESKETNNQTKKSECFENTNSKKIKSSLFSSIRKKREGKKWVINTTNPHTRYGVSPSSRKLNGVRVPLQNSLFFKLNSKCITWKWTLHLGEKLSFQESHLKRI